MLLAALLSGCSSSHPDTLGPREYVQYLQQPGNGLRKIVETGNMVYTVQLATPAFIASQELGVASGDSASTGARVDELSGNLYFLITMKPAGTSGAPLNTDAMASYYGGRVVKDLSLITAAGTLSPATCHFENNLGLVPHNTLVTAFSVGDKLTGDLKLVFNDRYSGNPMIQATFPARTILELPKLKI